MNVRDQGCRHSPVARQGHERMSTAVAKVLIVDDDPDIRRLVGDFLRREGLLVESAEDAAAMDAVLARVRPDVIVLDLMLPGEDGLSVCRRLRARDDTVPILVLSAKSDEFDRVLGLEMGADDYLVKPFGPREPLARALLRRSNLRSFAPASRRFAFDRFVIDLDARQLADARGARARGARTGRRLRAPAGAARHPGPRPLGPDRRFAARCAHLRHPAAAARGDHPRPR